jgi:hypothetical protein
MGSPSRYWQLVKLDTTGHRRVEEVTIAKEFFQQQFPELVGQEEVTDASIQRQLWDLMKQNEAGDSFGRLRDETLRDGEAFQGNRHPTPQLAELCLRCYISHIIDNRCRKLARDFGESYGFTASDLLPYVLDDVGLARRPANEYQSLSSRILDSYDPDKAALSTWVYRRLMRHDALEPVLLEHGVFWRTDWSLLNEALSTQLRMLRDFHLLSDEEIKQAKRLLVSYQAVYGPARIQQRASGAGRRCSPPTSEQLHQIAQGLQTKTLLSPQAVLSQLEALADQLRESRIAAKRGGRPQMSSIETSSSAAEQNKASAPDEESSEQMELLRRYQALFLSCLDETIAQVIRDRFQTLPRKRTPAQFITALKLLYCQGLSMTSIAAELNLGAQSQVTRLLQLTELRADIRQRWLATLQERVPELVRSFDSLERLKDWDQRLEQVLSEDIKDVLQEAVTETRSARNRPLTSRFAQRLCYYLDSLDPDALGE